MTHTTDTPGHAAPGDEGRETEMGEGMTSRVENALASVYRERRWQDDKWGIQRHDWATWMLILGEEFGEAAQAVLHLRFPPADTTLGPSELLDQVRTELVQLAAVAVAIVEHIEEAQENPDA